VKLGGQLVDMLRELRVRHQFFFLRNEVVVSFGLRESGLPVLADHDKGGKEYRLERHDKRQRRPRTLLEEQHPRGKKWNMHIDERHRAGERGDGVRYSKLDGRGSSFCLETAAKLSDAMACSQ
jgi:hypothetical protein